MPLLYLYIKYKYIVQQEHIFYVHFVPLCVNEFCFSRRTTAIFRTVVVFLEYMQPLHYTDFRKGELRLNNIVLLIFSSSGCLQLIMQARLFWERILSFEAYYNKNKYIIISFLKRAHLVIPIKYFPIWLFGIYLLWLKTQNKTVHMI